MTENLLEAISELAREKGIDRDEVTKIVEETIAAAARKKLSKYKTIEAQVNAKTGEVELFYYKLVTSFPQDSENEILLEDAQTMDPDAEEGDEVEYEIEQKEFNRIAQSARQLIFKRIRDAEREMIYNTFNERKGEILTGTVVRTEQGGRIAINFNKTEGYLFKREQIPGERFDHGEHIRVLLMDVSNDPKQPSQLVLSRTHPDFLIKLFEMEVPEVYDGLVEIIRAAREPGKRAKVSVYTSDPDIDPVGACVGMRGSRIQAIVSELRGEKIDIVHWDEELPVYVENAISPAEVERMEIDEEERQINILVDKDQLSLAIGRQGQNVRLASKLIGFKINVSSTEEVSNLSIDSQIALELEKSNVEAELQEEKNEHSEASETIKEDTEDSLDVKVQVEQKDETTAEDEEIAENGVSDSETISDNVVEPVTENSSTPIAETEDSLDVEVQVEQKDETTAEDEEIAENGVSDSEKISDNVVEPVTENSSTPIVEKETTTENSK